MISIISVSHGCNKISLSDSTENMIFSLFFLLLFSCPIPSYSKKACSIIFFL
uniref:Uncharacterized protein n=1 Tax=Oryza brachyantha TaxID=4533 RepID=J3MLD4_ORYBR